MLKSQTEGRRIGILRNDMLAAGDIEDGKDSASTPGGFMDGCFIHVMSSRILT